jgi:anthranilate synthase component 1
LPLALALRCPAAVIVDHLHDCTILIAEEGDESLLDQLEADLAAVPQIPPLPSLKDWQEDAAESFLDGVERVHEHLQAGDIFQVNLSRAWRAQYAEAPRQRRFTVRCAKPIPRRLPVCCSNRIGQWRVRRPSAWLKYAVAWRRPGRSPVRVPRLPGDDELARIRELSAHPKERAEHVMLIDLERNDLGRVCIHQVRSKSTS